MRAKVALFYLFLIHCAVSHFICNEDQIFKNFTFKFFNDTSSGRLLADDERQNLRIHTNFQHLTEGTSADINAVKRILNISASFLYLAVKVHRIQILKFPADSQPSCLNIPVPSNYITEGVIADLGVFVESVNEPKADFVAQAGPCAFLVSDFRPVFGIVRFNNPFLRFDREGFQQMVFIGVCIFFIQIHQLFHVLGFTSTLYSFYPAGNPLKQVGNDFYLDSPAIQRQIKKHFNCQSSNGALLQDRSNPSHWHRKMFGNQFMIPFSTKSSYISNLSLALLQTTGWYDVDYQYGQKTTWGKNKGCQFLSKDNCQFQQFCSSTEFACDWQGTAYGSCLSDGSVASCKLILHFTNTVCLDENFLTKNVHADQNTQELGGYLSKCFRSDLRQTGLDVGFTDSRCYYSICFLNFIFVLIGRNIKVCRTPGQVLRVPGFDGTITCPDNFNNYCGNKETCPFHCNKNGACVNGRCLCTGTTQFSFFCLDSDVVQTPIGTTGGLLRSKLFFDLIEGKKIKLSTSNESSLGETSTLMIKNEKCVSGAFLNTIFGECQRCDHFFGCQSCTENGCIVCDDGTEPFDGKCPSRE